MKSEEFRVLVNEELPSDMKCFAICDVGWSFNSKNLTSNREYSYYLPTFMLSSISDSYLGPDLKEIFARKDTERAKEAERAKAEEEKAA